jgi:hypothetical protein
MMYLLKTGCLLGVTLSLLLTFYPLAADKYALLLLTLTFFTAAVAIIHVTKLKK